jgi:hypothetical protein
MPEPEKRTYEAQSVLPLSVRPTRPTKSQAASDPIVDQGSKVSQMSTQQRRKLVQRLIDFMKTEL